MGRFRTWLIHLLGGVTMTDHKHELIVEYHKGINFSCKCSLGYMKRIYGACADDWCKKVYDDVSERYRTNQDFIKIYAEQNKILH